MKSIFLIAILTTWQFAYAKDIACESNFMLYGGPGGSIALEESDRAVNVSCDAGVRGYAQIDTNFPAVIVEVVSTNGAVRRVELRNPPADQIRNIILDPGSNAWVISQLRPNYGDVIYHHGFRIDSDSIFADIGLTRRADTSSRLAVIPSECIYQSEPKVVRSSGCQVSVCTATASCRIGNDAATGVISCAAIRNVSCPSATECALDASVTVVDPVTSENRNSGSGDSSAVSQ